MEEENIVYKVEDSTTQGNLPTNSTKDKFKFQFEFPKSYHEGSKKYILAATLSDSKKIELGSGQIKDTATKDLLFKWAKLTIPIHQNILSAAYQSLEEEKDPNIIYFIQDIEPTKIEEISKPTITNYNVINDAINLIQKVKSYLDKSQSSK